MSEEIRIQESNGAPRWYNRGYFILSLLIAAYFVVILTGAFSSSFRTLYTREILLPLLFFCVLILAVCVLFFRFLLRIEKVAVVALLIFSVAFAIRLLCIYVFPYELISDFVFYHELGRHFAEGNYAYVAGGSYIKNFAGMAVLYGIWMKIFGTSIFAVQIGNVVIASLSCVFIYLIGRQYEKRVGMVAGLLFTIYPANWFATIIPTNQNGSVLFSLIGLFLVNNALTAVRAKRAILLSAIGSVSFIISYYIHPTIFVMLIAIACFSIARLIRVRKKRDQAIRVAVVCVVVVATTLSSMSMITNVILVKAGLLPDGVPGASMLGPFVIGTNEESMGGYSPEDGEFVMIASPEEQAELILSRLSKVKKLPKLFYGKGETLWLRPDSHLFFYSLGYHAYLERAYAEDEKPDESLTAGSRPISDVGQAKYDSMQKILDPIGRVDSLFVIALYLLMIVGMIAMKRRKRTYAFEIVIWNIFGWVLLRMFAEVQPRYRYQVMPYIVLIASAGIVCCVDYFNKRDRGKRDKYNIDKTGDRKSSGVEGEDNAKEKHRQKNGQ
jgi:hypothetical protein